MNVTGLDPNAHNLILDLMAETGAIGALCAVAVLLMIASALARRPPRARTLMAGSSLVVFMVHSTIEYPLWYAHLLIVFAIVLSLDTPAKIQRVRRFAGPAIVAGMMLCWWFVATDYVELRSITRAATDPKTLGAFVLEREQGDTRWIRGPLRPLKEMVLWQGIPLAAIEARHAAAELDRVAAHFPTEVLVFHHISTLWIAGRHADAMKISGHAAVAIPNVLLPIEREAERRRILGESGWEGLADAIANLRLERKIDGP